MNTWQRNPQDPADEHDWTRWFADHTLFRDVRMIPGEGWYGDLTKAQALNELTGADL
jgi:hypothetical protein